MTLFSGQLVKAEISNMVSGEKITCMFNPKEYTFSKQNKWSEQPAKGKNVARLEFGGGTPATLKLQLLFDTCEAHLASVTPGDDVRKYTKGLWDLMKVSEQKKNSATGKGEPPHCKFQWGSLWSFEAVVESISQKFTLFRPDGTPLRAILDVSFRQIQDEGQYPRQNPTSGGNPGEHLRAVREGETLAWIAYEEFGDAGAWRHIAQLNNIADPLRLRPGQLLLIVPLPSQ
jgi:hypothetical protein